MTAVVVKIAARVIEDPGAVLEFTDAERRELARLSAAIRPPHPIVLA